MSSSNRLEIRIDTQELEDHVLFIWEPIPDHSDNIPVIQEYWKYCRRNVFDAFKKSLSKDVQDFNNGEINQKTQFEQKGQTLFDNFVEDNFFKEHLGSKSKLHVYLSTRMVEIPWELTKIHEDARPWGIEYAIGNQVRGPFKVKHRTGKHRNELKVLLIAADKDLMSVKEEIIRIRDSILASKKEIKIDILVDQGIETMPEDFILPGNSSVACKKLNMDTFLEHFVDEYDVIHFAGHIRQIETGNQKAGALVIPGNGKEELIDSPTIYNKWGIPFIQVKFVTPAKAGVQRAIVAINIDSAFTGMTL